MEMLKEGLSVKDIAACMNFSSPYYLSYFFKRETGMTARDYLKSIDNRKIEYDKRTGSAYTQQYQKVWLPQSRDAASF